MKTRSEDLERFFKRWSRRKLGRDAEEKREPDVPSERERASPPASETDPQEFAEFDFSSLDFASDFSRFMRDNVPDSVRNRALKQLWTSSETISRPDDLDDYLEDFREEVMGLPAELARSAYRIGQGFVPDNAPSADESASAELAGDAAAKAEPALPLPVAQPTCEADAGESERETSVSETEPKASSDKKA